MRENVARIEQALRERGNKRTSCCHHLGLSNASQEAQGRKPNANKEYTADARGS